MFRIISSLTIFYQQDLLRFLKLGAQKKFSLKACSSGLGGGFCVVSPDPTLVY